MERNIISLSFNDTCYPALLKEIPDAPTKLFHIGSLPPIDAVCVAIVGTRKATTQGKLVARQIAKDLASYGIIIVSGLAIGIDTAAHEGALESEGRTLAVLANGLDTIYPSQNSVLAENIIKRGAIISEYPLTTPAYPNQFLERNRIVSGLCIATIVIEAPERSGTLATARFALEQGREVFVIPGSFNHPNYAGSHRLIRDGARLVTSAADILEDLGIPVEQAQQNNQPTLWQREDASENAIIATLTETGQSLSVDKLSELTKLEAHVINATLTTLVISGVIKETECGYSI